MIPELLKTAILVLAKELKDLVRDPRSLILSLLLPLILFPLLFWVVSENDPQTAAEERRYRLAYPSALETSSLLDRLRKDPDFLLQPFPLDSTLNGLPGSSADRPAGHELFRRGDFDLLLIPDNEEMHQPPILLYDNSDKRSVGAYQHVQLILHEDAVLPPAPAVALETRFTGIPLYPPEEAAGMIFLSLVLPFMIFIFGATCPLPIAADLSAGEKERGSLEPLASTAAPRSGIVLGKLAAAVVAGALSVTAYFGGVYLSSLISPAILGDEPMRFLLNPAHYMLLILLTLEITALFACLEFCAGLVARSVREAQLLGMPILILAMGAVYLATAVEPGATPTLYLHLPLVNLALAVRKTALMRISTLETVTSTLWAALYLAGAVVGAFQIFKREATLTSH